MSLLAKYFKGFPEKQALKGTLSTVIAYKGSKYISNMIGESMTKVDPNNPNPDPKLAEKKPMWEFIGSAGSLVVSMFAYTKIKSKDIGFGLVLGSGVNVVDKFMLLPSVKTNIPKEMQPLFSGNDSDISSDDYMRRVNDARYNFSEDDVKSIVNAAKVNGYLDGFGGDLGEDVIAITPEERMALLDNSAMNGYDPTYEEYDRPAGLGEDMFAGLPEEEFA